MAEKNLAHPLFSIVTVVYNAQDTVQQTIESVLAQTYSDYEYIVIDGSSTDNTLTILERYRESFAYFVSEPDKGIYDAMNKAIGAAKGEYILFLNADDYFYNNEVLQSVYEQVKDKLTYYDVLVGAVEVDYGDYKIVRKPLYDLKHLKKGKMPPHQGFFCRGSLLKDIGAFDLGYRSSSDLDLVISIWSKQVDTLILKNTIAYMKAGGTSSEKSVSYVETARIIRKHFGYGFGLLFKLRKIIIEQNMKKYIGKLLSLRVYEIVRRKYLRIKY